MGKHWEERKGGGVGKQGRGGVGRVLITMKTTSNSSQLITNYLVVMLF